MTFIYDSMWFEPGSRLTGIWQWPWPGDDDADDLMVLLSKVSLGDGQDGALESDFLSSHTAWAFGGIHGVGPDGSPWLVLAQIAPAVAGALVSSPSPWWALADGLDRALRFNAEADLGTRIGMNRDDLVRVYGEAGVAPERLTDWTVPDLVSGLLAECAYVPLPQVVAGAVTGCALPDIDHDCQHDVFRDVFAAWTAGLVTLPPEPDWEAPPAHDEQLSLETETDVHESADGDDDTEERPVHSIPVPPTRVRWRWRRSYVKKWSTERLRLQAVEDGWSAKKARKANRKKVMKYLTNPHRLRRRFVTRRLKPQPTVLRRVELEAQRGLLSDDWAVVATWVSGALHVARCDYGDGYAVGEGFDIDDPLMLLAALIRDRFRGVNDLLTEYLRRNNLEFEVMGNSSDPEVVVDGIAVAPRDELSAEILDWDAQSQGGVCVMDWPSVTLALLADRSQGVDALGRVIAVVRHAEVSMTRRDRGYV